MTLNLRLSDNFERSVEFRASNPDSFRRAFAQAREKWTVAYPNHRTGHVHLHVESQEFRGHWYEVRPFGEENEWLRGRTVELDCWLTPEECSRLWTEFVRTEQETTEHERNLRGLAGFASDNVRED